jgi:hypothetical protein
MENEIGLGLRLFVVEECKGNKEITKTRMKDLKKGAVGSCFGKNLSQIIRSETIKNG